MPFVDACSEARFCSVATEEVDGWPQEIYRSSAAAYNEHYGTPKEMSISDIERFRKAWEDAAKRAIAAGFDVIEIHHGYGYLLHSFSSPATYHRTDRYGESFENRIRLTVEIVEIARRIMPKDMPLFLRISATDWLEELQPPVDGWKVEDTIRFAEIVASKVWTCWMLLPGEATIPDSDRTLTKL